MRVMIDVVSAEELFLHRENDLADSSEKLKSKIDSSSEVQFCITQLCWKRICSLANINPLKNVNALANALESRFTICEVLPVNFENARQYPSDIYSAIEVECALAMDCNAIISEQPDKYSFPRERLPVWSVNDFCYRASLELSLELSLDDRFSLFEPRQLSFLPESEDVNNLKYMMRNTISVIKVSFKILQSVGCKGLTRENFSNKLQRSPLTTQSIIWDLEHFQVITCTKERIKINSNLLDMEENDFLNYLSIALKKHELVKEIYQELETKKIMTRWKLQEIIGNLYTCSGMTSDKTLRDYRSRLTSWLISTKLIAKKGKDCFTLPTNQSYRTSFPDTETYQLELFQ